MAQSLKDLAKKDPSFYKYLEENDRELLEFGKDEGKGKKVVVKKGKTVATKVKGKGKGVIEEEEEEEEGDQDMDNFDGASSDDDEEEPEFNEEADEEEDTEPEKISVTMKMLRGWQRAMIEVSLCKMLESEGILLCRLYLSPGPETALLKIQTIQQGFCSFVRPPR